MTQKIKKKGPGRPKKKSIRGRPRTWNKRPVGRPPFAVNEYTRQKVERLLAAGISFKGIAAFIGCTVPTLYVHFKEELELGLERRKAEIIDMIYQSADEGNVASQHKLYAILHKPEAKENESTVVENDKKLGKKEQQQLDADKVHNRLETPSSPPKLVVSNK